MTDVHAGLAPAPAPARAPQRGPLTPALLVLIVGLVAALAITLLRSPTATAATPADDSAAAGFARDMAEHHGQAVDMSMIVRDATKDPAVRRLAYDIALGQQHQIGQMAAWLTLWGLPQTGPGPVMAWMGEASGHAGHGGHGGGEHSMPGMATAAQLDELRRLSGRAAELRYLSLMIPHHQGGVAMADAVLARTDVAVVRDLAQKMKAAQQAEIDLLKAMIAERGGVVPA